MTDESHVAVVTGAAGGIGEAVVTTLLDGGWAVVGVDLAEPGSHDPSGDLPEYAVRTGGSRALAWVRGDVADEDVLARAITEARSLGAVRGLVTATLSEARGPLEGLDRATVARVLDLQVGTAWAWSDAVARAATSHRSSAAGAAAESGSSQIRV